METVAPDQVSRTYTILLSVYGGLSLLLALALGLAAPSLGGELQPQLLFSSYIHLVFGIAAILVALLRQIRGAASLPVSNALSIALAIELPLGTALFVYWMAKVRKAEQQQPSAPKPVRWYTTGLFIAALGFSMSFAPLRFAAGSGDPDDILILMAWVYVGAAALLAAVAVVRSVSRRWGYYATFGLSIILLPLLPVGTIASLIWFLKVRQHEQGMVPVVQGTA